MDLESCMPARRVSDGIRPLRLLDSLLSDIPIAIVVPKTKAVTFFKKKIQGKINVDQ